MAATVEAVEAASALIVSQKPETLVILSPHNYVFPDGAAVIAVPRLYGNLAAFGYPELSMDVRTDMDLAEEIVNKASQQTDIYRLDTAWSDRFGHPLSVDQGTFVPLYYLRKAGFTGPIVIMAPRFDDYDSMTRLGDIVIKAAKALGRRIAVIASGDLSHRLLQGSPNGYTPNGAVFDKLVMEALLKQNLSGLTDLSRSFIDEIATCGLPSVYFYSVRCVTSVRSCRSMPMKRPLASATVSPCTFPKARKTRSKSGLPRTSESAWPVKASPTTFSIMP